MKPHHARRRIGGFTFIEGLVCAVILAVLTGLLLPAFSKAKTGRRFNCALNQRQIGLAYRMWSSDHGEKFPWEVKMKEGGTMEYARSTESWRHFQAISNEVYTPKVFACSRDKERLPSHWWDSFTNNSRLSYFIGLEASELNPQTILSGDRNLGVSRKLLRGMASVTSNINLAWTPAIHETNGYVGLADGSVSPMSSEQLNRQLQSAFLSTTQATLRFVFPQ